MTMIPFSVLDLSPIAAGSTPADALRNTRELAQLADSLGFNRYWLAEHHNMTGIASAATSIVIGHVAAATKNIRVGSGGIMLPNHAPLVIAEQFGTLASLFPGRIDLGLGRAPGSDQATARALRRESNNSADSFPDDVVELQRLFGEVAPGQRIQAVPGGGLEVPIWLLGSSLFGAQLAAALGLPFAFASHFAPDYLMMALQQYRAAFKPSRQLQRPYVMVGVNVFAADQVADARRSFTSLQQQFLNLRRGTPGKLPAPVERVPMNQAETEMVERALAFSVVGTREHVEDGLAQVIERTGADELMITAQMFDHRARLRSFEIVAEARQAMAGVAA
jgi:luciferase family oxidoreductase group 1